MKSNILKSLFTAAVLSISSVLVPFSVNAADKNDTKLIALTFDDGPNTTTTNEILDILVEYDAKASFFLIGDNINKESTESVKRAYDMGCEINNHSKSHPNMGGMSPEEITAEVEYVNEKVMEITGEMPKFFRPPFIDVSQTMYDTIDLPFICGIDCKDYMDEVSAQQRAESILNGAKDGIIVLLHDAAGNDQTVEALEIVMPELVEQGYEFVTLTELFERQGETPKGNMIYTCVAKYPCTDYSLHKNIFTGEATGDGSWPDWSNTAVLDGAELKSLGSSYAIEVEYTASNPPVIVLQKWTDGSVWQPVQPFYSNGEKACFLADDIIYALEQLELDYTDLNRITIYPFSGTMTMTQTDILVKSESAETIAGDVNKDGKFTVADLVSLNNFLLGNGTLKNESAGDMYHDELIDTYDLIVMRKEITK